MKKKSYSQPFLAYPAGGQETTFYLRVALAEIVVRLAIETNLYNNNYRLKSVTKKIRP